MAVNKEVILCFSWFVVLTATAKGYYKSCSEIQDAKENVSTPYIITIGNKNVNVSCNLTAQPATTIIKVNDAFEVPNPHLYQSAMSFTYEVNYGILTADDIRAFIEKRESCKQYVSYKCSNATLFGKNESSSSSWTSVEDTPKHYWANCSFLDKTCQCDQGKNVPEKDAGYLRKKKDLPVKGVQIGGLSAGSNVSVMVGNIECYGDSQKRAFTFEDKNAFVSLNVSTIKELKFKFKSLKYHKSTIIASIRLQNGKDIKIRLNKDLEFCAGFLTFHQMDEEWHSIVLTFEAVTISAVLDNGIERVVYESSESDIVVEKLVLGSQKRVCDSFIGCIKDLTVDGHDYSKMITEAKMKEFVKDGCSTPVVQCRVPNVEDIVSTVNPGLSTEPSQAVKPNFTVKPNTTLDVNGGGKEKKNNTGDGSVSSEGGNNNAVIIAVVVVFLILFIILVVVFLITWYLKRNKGVYQTHEGSAENIHGDTDNLTLVTKPSEDDPDSEKGKEYYL